MGKDIKLLDCTLRDGGYINDWNWGEAVAKGIVSQLTAAEVDVIEIGFLRNTDSFDSNLTIADNIHELNTFIPDSYYKRNGKKPMLCAMAMHSNYSIDNLEPYCGAGIELIRVTAHENDINEGIEFACKVNELGYKVSFNPINIMGYTDAQLLEIIDKVNQAQIYQFSIVDTFGSMRKKDLERIVCIADNNLNPNIRLGLHLHENMSLGCLLAQQLINMNLKRAITIDGSLMGMGRTPGNLPLELIADYMNEQLDKSYDIDHMMDAIQDYVAPYHGECRWGYAPAYFLSARHNLHRNYAEFYLDKGTLTNRDIDAILARIERRHASVFDKDYADKMYEEYMSNRTDDTDACMRLKSVLEQKDILVIAPGTSIRKEKSKIDDFIDKNTPIIIAVNFNAEDFEPDYIFCSNPKRYEQTITKNNNNLIITSNIHDAQAQYIIDYNHAVGNYMHGQNSLIVLLRLLKELDVRSVYLAGADGYAIGQKNYYNSNLRNYSEHGDEFNHEIAGVISRLNMNIKFLTASAYDERK